MCQSTIVTLGTVQKYAEDLISKDYHIKTNKGMVVVNLTKEGYTFAFNRRKKSFGVCCRIKKIIFLSRPLCEVNLDKLETDIRDTILHEIAHAIDWIVFKGWGHKASWRYVAKAIGCTPERCYDAEDVTTAKTKYTLTCPNCGATEGMGRKPKLKYVCKPCYDGGIGIYRVILTKNW